MADTQFSPLGTVTAPADWRLPPSLELVLKAAQATYDGTGAGGSFQPALQIISDSGHSVGIYTCDTTIAAGSSCEVSFFPFSPSSAGGGTDPLAVHYDHFAESGDFVDINTTVGGFSITDTGGPGSGIRIESDGDGATFGGGVTIGTANGQVFVGSEIVIFRFPDSAAEWKIEGPTSLDWHVLDGFGGVQFRLGDAAGQSFFVLDHVGATLMQIIDGGTFVMKLPAVNPGGTNRLWNNGGVVNIT